jgi:hypothetical protein
MAVVTFRKPVGFPIAPLRELLTRHLPLYRWHCGEGDMGGATDSGAFRDHDIITGRSATTVILTELRATHGQYEATAAPHDFHLQVGEPTTELKPIADRIVVIVCLGVMMLDPTHARCQLRPGGDWLGSEDLARLLDLLLDGEDLSVADGLGTPPTAPSREAPIAGPAQALPIARDTAPSVAFGAGAARRMLPPLILLLDRPLVPDWAEIKRFAALLDPEGGWRHAGEGGANLLVGRGTRVTIRDKPEPLPSYVHEDSYSRSSWYHGDKEAVAAHRRQVIVGTPLDTQAADWITTRQVAKVVTLVAGLLARLPGTLAVLNLATGTIFEPQMVGGFLSALGQGQLPVALWTFAAWHGLEDGNVSVSTSGLEPFLGHEIEAWNAPLSREAVQQKVSDLIVYLLQQGPVIGHGGSAGSSLGDLSIRGFLGPSRAERCQRVEALCLEFGEERVQAPRPDPAGATPATPPSTEQAGRAAAALVDDALRSAIAGAAAPRPAAAPSGPPRPACGFGRKGL